MNTKYFFVEDKNNYSISRTQYEFLAVENMDLNICSNDTKERNKREDVQQNESKQVSI
jgi:hypothetical protein